MTDQQNDRPHLADPRPQDFAPQGESFGRIEQPDQAMMPAGQTLIQSQGAIITAQRVAVARDHNRIVQRLNALCAMAGDRYIYSWDVKDNRAGRKTQIKGPTIKLANDLAREYGNCIVETRVQDFPGYWLFYARFVDVETGFSTTRAFQQRKSQNTGMKDADRQADIVFQIGQSKAIRNVIVNALSTYVDLMMESSEEALIDKVRNNAEKANAYIDKVLEHHDIGVNRVEATVGRSRSKWTVRDLAKVYAECRGIAENLTVAEDIYPLVEGKAEKAKPDDSEALPETAAADDDKKPAKPAEEKKPAAAAKKGGKAKAEDKPKPAAKEPEPEPEPEGEQPDEAGGEEPEAEADEGEPEQPASGSDDSFEFD